MGRKKKKHPVESPEKPHPLETELKDNESSLLKVYKPEILLIGVFLLALTIRLLYLSQIIQTPVFHGLALDSDKYDSFALYILKGNLIHKDFIYLNPLYPFFLSFIYLIGGHSYFAVAFIQALIDSISSLFIYFIASTLFNKKVGVIAAFIYALYGIAIFYTGILLAPTVVIFLTLLFISSLIFAEQRGKVFIFFVSGVFFGLAGLARPNVILFLFFLPFWFFTLLKNRLGIYKSIQGFLLLLVGFLMVLSLISIRNYSIEKRFSPFSVQGGLNFYIGNNPAATGRLMSHHGISNSPIDQVKTSIHYAEKEAGEKLTPSQASRYWLLKGVTFIRDNPIDAFFLYMKKFSLFWRNEEIPLNIHYPLNKTFAPIFRFPFISFGIIAPFALLGIILFLKRKETPLLVILFIFSYMVSVIMFFISARYRLPIVPFLIICSSYFIYRFAEMIREKRVQGVASFASILILFFIGININFGYFKFVSDYEVAHYNLGNAYLKENLVKEAIDEYKKALAINPDCGEAYTNLGNAYAKKGMFTEAIAEHRKAIAINPDLAEAHANLGAAYIDKGVLDEAITECRKALSINPEFAMAHSNLGLAYSVKGMLDESIAEFKKALAIDSDYVEARTNLGAAYIRKGMLDEAIAEFRNALDLNPNFAMAHYNLGNAYLKKGELNKAISEYNRAVSLKPDYAKVHNGLAVAYYSKKDYKLSLFHCNKAVELGGKVNSALLAMLSERSKIVSDSEITHYNRGNDYLKRGLIKEAVDEYKEAIRANPDYVDAYNNLGNAYAKKGKLDEAIAEFDNALAIDSNYVEARTNLGAVYVRKGMLDEAIAEFKNALDLNPNFAMAHYNLGNAYLKKGELNKAIFEYNRAVVLKPDYADAHNNLAAAYYLKKDYKLSLFHYDRAVELGGRVNPKLRAMLKPHR